MSAESPPPLDGGALGGRLRVSRRRVIAALRVDLANQARFSFPQIYLGLSVAYAAAFLFVAPLREWREFALPIFLFSEPGLLGFYFAAIHFYFERADGSLDAIAVTPLRPAEYVLGRALSVALIATTAGTLVAAGALGPSLSLAPMALALFTTALVFGLTSLALATRFPDTVRFLFGTIPAVTVFVLPMLSLLGIGPSWATLIVPSHSSMFAMRALAEEAPRWESFGVHLTLLLAFAYLAFVFAERAVAGVWRPGGER